MTVKAVKPADEPDETPMGLDALTAAESAAAERQAAQSITTLGNENFPQINLIGALGWVLARRKNPALKFDHYMSSHTVAQITRELGLSSAAAGEPEEEGKGSGTST
jgi:hypothetical protein